MTNTNAKIQRNNEGKLFIFSPDYDTVKARLEGKWFQDDKIIRFVSKTGFSPEFIADFSKIASASIISDGVIQEEEKFVAKEICKELDIPWESFNELLDQELQKISQNNYKSVKEYLINSHFGAHTKSSLLLFEAALHIVLADGIMTDKESVLLADVAELLSLPLDKVISRIAQFIRFEKEVLVDVHM
jgi:tellurite resistance protein